MFGTACHPIVSTLAHFDHIKGQLSLLIFHNFLNVLTINLIYMFTVCILVYMFVCVCACVCMGSCKYWFEPCCPCLLWSPYVIGQTIIFSCCGYFFLMAALCNRAGHYILPCAFFFLLLLSIFFPSPNLSSHRLDV